MKKMGLFGHVHPVNIRLYRELHHCLTVGTNHSKEGATLSRLPCCDPLGARTQDPNIKSVVLYQLS